MNTKHCIWNAKCLCRRMQAKLFKLSTHVAHVRVNLGRKISMCIIIIINVSGMQFGSFVDGCQAIIQQHMHIPYRHIFISVAITISGYKLQCKRTHLLARGYTSMAMVTELLIQ